VARNNLILVEVKGCVYRVGGLGRLALGRAEEREEGSGPNERNERLLGSAVGFGCMSSIARRCFPMPEPSGRAGNTDA
jgi:hypothetical protein